MGFLDDLKRQADAARNAQTTDTASLERNTALADMACKSAFQYFATLAQQLNVLRPKSQHRYTLDKRHAFDGLERCAFRADARRKPLRGAEVYDHVVLMWTLKSGQRLQLVKDFLPDIEKLEARLRQSGANVQTEAVRNPANNKLVEMRYAFDADFAASVRVTPDHDRGRVAFQIVNVDALETVSVEFPAIELGSARLDELARWLVGEPNAFLKDGQNLRRIEP